MKKVRQQISLDGAWDFQIDAQNVLTPEQITEWRTAQVPGPWQAQFDDLHLTAGVGWYRRLVDVPADWEGRVVFLCFGAVDYYAEVWVNGQRAGHHEGGYLPFEFDVSTLLKYGEASEIVVRAVDPGGGIPHFGMSDEGDIFPEFPFNEIPHGKQSWYGPIGGIWQSVRLEARAAQFIRQVHVTPEGLSGQVSTSVQLAGDGEQISLRCLSPGGEVVAETESEIEGGEIEIAFTVSNPAIWDLDTPSLYTLEVDLLAGGEVVDRQTVTFGIRTFEVRDGKLWFNGRVFYMRGALDQDYYPEGIYTPPSLNYLRDQFRKGKAMGLNTLRCHIKAPDPRYLQAADEVGLLIWVDVPNWVELTEDAKRRARETFAGMVARDWNHPSLVMWALVNEGWGTDLPNAEEDRRWLLEAFAWAREVDPHRVIVDNSPCKPNFHMQTQVDDFHFYAAMPDSMDKWQDFVTAFANRADFTFSPHDDGARAGDEPLVVSEFGNWGLPDIARLRDAYGGKEPWWFETGGEYNVVLPRGAEERFKALGLEKIFGDWSGLAEAAQWAQYRALKHEIEIMRVEPSIQGYVITEFTDLHWECNGLMDMVRNPRAFADVLPHINADTIIIPRWERQTYWSDETAVFNLFVSHYGVVPLAGVTLRWELEGTDLSGAFVPLDVASGEVAQAGKLALDVPKADDVMHTELRFWLELPDGNVVAENTQALSLFPAAARHASEPRVVWGGDDADLQLWLASHGYTVDEANAVHIMKQLDEKTLRYVKGGGRALLVMTDEGAVPGFSDMQVMEREGTIRAGDWASSFGWVQPGLTRLSRGALIDFGWRETMPQHVIIGAPAEYTLAGMFVGWIHAPAGFAVRMPLGQGVLTVATFPILPVGNTPARVVLLHDLVEAASM